MEVRVAADTRDKDNGDNEEVPVILKVDLLDHLETADCDEAVESYADAAHDAGGNGGEEGCERGDKGDDYRKNCGGDDGCD